MTTPADVWHSLLRPEVELTEPFCRELTDRMRAARLTFGDRVHCPFMRPFFLSEADEARVRHISETIAALGERVAAAAIDTPALLDQFALSEAEERLVRLEPGYPTASTASRLDAFLLPDSLQFAEYNAESPAGLGYSERLAQIFDDLPVMGRFKAQYDVRSFPLMERLLDALMASYREWGGRERAPAIAIVDWREVPTWSEFEIIRDRFNELGVPTFVCDPRELEFDGRTLAAHGRRIDLVYRRVLVGDIVARLAESAALVSAYQSRAVCVANTFRCKIPHKKSFFAVLTDARNAPLFTTAEQGVIRRHVPWTRLVRDQRTERDGETIDLLPYVRRRRAALVLKPNDEYGGSGVTLGWESDARGWDQAIDRALAEPARAWIVQERIAIRREVFPQFENNSVVPQGFRPPSPVTMREMLVDFAPYLFRGRMAGFLTRLSATGLANVTSGGGQVPAFVVTPK